MWLRLFMGVLPALLLVFAVLRDTCQDTLTTSVMIFFVIMTAQAFSLAFRGLGGERVIQDRFALIPGGTTTAILFFFRGVAPPEVKTGAIYRGMWPFIYIQLAAVVIVMLFPTIATWLPTSMGWMNK